MKKVVLVDDNEMDLMILQKYFEGTGISVSARLDCNEVVSDLKEGDIDLLITDYDMPGMSGVELARVARALSPGVKVWCVTASVEASDREAIERQCNAVFSKPMRYDSFIRELRMAFA